VVLVTAMDRPLGIACGNALEVVESIASLRGNAPDDLLEVSLALGVEMLLLAKVDRDPAAARARLEATISSGAALEVFRQIIAAQGGDPAVVDNPALLPRAPVQCDVLAAQDGVVTQVEPRALGRAIIELGGGRRAVTDTVLPDVGLEVFAKPGARLRRGERLAVIHARSQVAADAVTPAVSAAISIADVAVPALPLIAWRVSATGEQPYGATS
jgi:pyrimidine-nucleoside phosphorylase